MNYLDYAFDLNQLESKFENSDNVVSAIKELRSAFINEKEINDIIDIFFKVLNVIPTNEDGEYDQDDIDAAYEDGYNEAIDEATSLIGSLHKRSY